MFLTGTDEHGQKIQRAAEKSNKDPQSFCDEISENFRKLSKTLNLSNNDFIRTTESRHLASASNLWKILEDNKEIYLSKYSGWYSVSDEAFYVDDEIQELNGKKIAKTSGSEVEWVEEESYFFRLSKWEKPLLDFYKKNPKFILPESRKNEVISFVKSGLKDLSVSRKSFSWGIKVPSNADHVIYVWLDALTNYIMRSIIQLKRCSQNFSPQTLSDWKRHTKISRCLLACFLISCKYSTTKRVWRPLDIIW